MALAITAFFYGCAEKEKIEVFNKPAMYWYENIMKEVRFKDLEKADDYYTSLSSEHISSPLLQESMLILATAHMDNEEYILANFYLDEYIKRFGTKATSEYARYLKVKAGFLAFAYPNRDQQLLIDTIKDAEDFLKQYPNSKYKELTQTMITKMYLAKYYLEKEIMDLYQRTDKLEAAKIYDKRLKSSWLHKTEMIDPDLPFYRAIFE